MDFLNDCMHTVCPGSQALLRNPLSPGQEQMSGLHFSIHVFQSLVTMQELIEELY